jgi:hypothetical protein
MKQKELDWLKNEYIKTFFKILILAGGFVLFLLIIMIIMSAIINIGGIFSVILLPIFIIAIIAGIITLAEYDSKKSFDDFQ